MGCASSAYSKTPNIDILSSQHRATSTNTNPTDAAVIKDMPEVVEKVIDVIKDTDADMVTIQGSDLKNENTLAETILNDILSDTVSESSTQGYVQGFIADNGSPNLSETVLENIENYKVEGSSFPVFRDIDSLNTSSPESEIEQALANNNGHNPPTPKPTLSELEDLYKFPTSNIESAITSSSPIKDINKIIYSKSVDTSIVRCEPTDWEKQADMLASTRKYNPIEAMRKLKRESTRAASSLPQKDFKPRNHHCIEESLNDLFSQSYTQSPVQSGIPSANSERSSLAIPSATDADMVHANKQTDRLNCRVQDVKRHNDTNNKQKELHLTVTKNVKLPSSPSNFKVRERCAVCCNKYKT